MEESLRNLSCTEFSEKLFSKAPVPGGGGAAAYIAALGASLGAMAGNLTSGKKKYAVYEDDIQRMLGELGGLRCRLLELIDEDAKAFEPLSKAYSLPKDTPGYADTMRAVTLGATAAPYEMMKLSCRVIEILEEMHEKCSRLLISDVGCGAAAAEAALKAASLNVFINTKTLRGDAEADAIAKDASNMLETYTVRAAAVYSAVLAVLKGE